MPRRGIRWFCWASFLAWSLVVVFRPGHPFGDLTRGIYTDHISHMNLARYFPRAGLDVWRRPLRAQLRPLTRLEIDALPADQRRTNPRDAIYYDVPGWPRDKPLLSGWTQNPRLYPPGDMLLAAPFAALYSFTSVSFATINRALIVWYLLLAHLGLALLFEGVLRLSAHRLLVAFVFFYAYGTTMRATLEGFYDAAVIAPLVLSALLLAARRGVAASLAFSAASVVHFRALFFAPWGAEAALLALRSIRRWRRPQWLAAVAAMLLMTATLIPLFILRPTLRTLPNDNWLSPGSPLFRPAFLILYLSLAALAAIVFLRARSRADLLVLGWFTVMLVVNLRQTAWWHPTALFAWVAAPVRDGKDADPWRDTLVLGGRIGILMFITSVVFHQNAWYHWLVQVL
ncbi:MAG TPA: hypothetical protein VHB97_05090 [Polyangia bacterium]|nr:hypothetical protein [Polyangia bacterium]